MDDGSHSTRDRLARLSDQILIGVTTERQRAEAFKAAFEAVARMPLRARVFGVEVEVDQLLVLGGGELRAVARWGSASAYLPLDALELPPEQASAHIVGAYRYTLGYFDGGPLSFHMPYFESPPSAPVVRVEAHEGAIRAEIEALFAPASPVVTERAVEGIFNLSEAILELAEVGAIGGAERLYGELMDTLFRVAPQRWGTEEMAYAVERVMARWLQIRVRQEADPAQTLKRLADWHEPASRWTDPWGLVIRYGTRPEHLALEQRLRDELSVGLTSSGRMRTLRDVLLARGDIEGFAALLHKDAWSCEDFLAVVERLREQGETEEAVEMTRTALARFEKSMTRWNSAIARLSLIFRELLTELGRGEEAFTDAWETFVSTHATDVLRDALTLLPAEERQVWVGRAFDEVEDLGESIELAIVLDQWLDVAERLEGVEVDTVRAVSSWSLQKLAPRLESDWPQSAITVYFALAWRHLDRGNTRYYHLAIEALEAALDVAGAIDATPRWRVELEHLKARHGRKRSFTSRLKPLLTRVDPPPEPKKARAKRAPRASKKAAATASTTAPAVNAPAPEAENPGSPPAPVGDSAADQPQAGLRRSPRPQSD